MFNRYSDPDWSYDPDLDALERLSNGVIDLIERGRLDEAQRNCLELKTRFPDQIDWIERSAAVCEARGRVDEAIEHYRRCLVFIDSHPDGFDSDSREWYRSQINRLRPESNNVGSY
jgi:hypothetical protein